MIFKTEEQEEELVLGEIETVESNIDISENLAFVLDTVSSKFYSDPIGSIVREITSNCFDAHVEAQVDEPVVIKLYYDLENEGYSIEFIDRGVGMNDQRFNKIYMNWFSSTKRNTNDQIGGWGLGSKSPFAFTNQFMITTVADGIKTTRILSKVQGGLPKAETVYRKETTEHNGTTIKIFIKEYSDAKKFETAIKNQLTYFDNVFVDGSSTFAFENNYQIYDCKYFKYRSGTSDENYNEFSTRAESQKMHILLGNVKYPINWTVINMHQYIIPIGVKFNIGEIAVTPNREAIEYREESIALIKERINHAVRELQKIFNDQNPVVEDFSRYLLVRNETPRITFKPSPDSSVKHYLYMNGLNVNKKVTFLPLKEIESLPTDFFFEYRVESIENGLLKEKRRTGLHNDNIVRNRISHYYYTKGMTKYGNLFINQGKVIVKQKLSFKGIREELGYEHYRSRNNTYSWYKQVSKKQNSSPPKLGSAYAVWKFRKFTDQLVSNLTLDYPTVTDEWIKDFKKKQNEESAQTRRKLNQLVLYYTTSGGRPTEIPIHSLAKSQWIIYVMKDQENKFDYFNRCERMLRDQNPSIIYRLNKKDKEGTKFGTNVFKFIVINSTNYKHIKHLNNLIHIDNLFRIADLQPILNRVYLATRWDTEWLSKFRLLKYGLKDASPYYYKLGCKIENFIIKYGCTQIIHQLDEIRDKIKPYGSHHCTWNIRQVKKELDAFLTKANVLMYITSLPIEYQKILINHSLKVTKLDYIKYGNSDQIQADRPKLNRNPSRWRTLNQESSGEGREGSNNCSSEGSNSETNQSELSESREVIHCENEGNQTESRDSKDQGESCIEEIEEGREESGCEFYF